MSKPSEFGREERVLGGQARKLNGLQQSSRAAAETLDEGIAKAEALLSKYGASLPECRFPPPVPVSTPSAAPTFDELVVAAPGEASLRDALDNDEIEACLARLKLIGKAPAAETAVDRWDIVIAGTAGMLAGIAELVLVGLPQYQLTQGGPLSNHVRKTFGRLLPPATVAGLELAYPVPFDLSTNSGLMTPITGLSPTSHRFQSLGHDPLLGWFFGVRDVLAGSFTAISRDGILVVQETGSGTPGELLFSGFLEAFRTVGAHLVSDVSTPMGLPAPMLPIAQFLQFGSIGPRGYTVAEISRQMYRERYDFRHFVAGSLTTAIVEVIIRGAWIIRCMNDGNSFVASLPNAAAPRLRRQLLMGHAVATLVNAGKIGVLGNPCALNWSQWLALLRYLVPELRYLLTQPSRRAAAQDAALDADLRDLSKRADILAALPEAYWPGGG